MKLDIYRKKISGRSTTGQMFVDNQFECYTIEPDPKTPVHEGHPSIPAGIVFEVKLTLSPHFHYVTPEIMNVPNRTYIRIHRANKPEDLLGCTGVGETLGPQADWVGASEAAFDKLMVLLKTAADKGEKITAEWHDPQ